MKENDMLKCTVVILNFLLLSDDEYDELKIFNTPSNVMMTGTLAKYDMNMVSFTEFVTKEFKLERLWNVSAREFFSDKNKSINFFTDIIN